VESSVLSLEERLSLVEEAADTRRREELRLAKKSQPRPSSVGEALSFLSQAAAFFGPRAVLPRRRPRAGGNYQL